MTRASRIRRPVIQATSPEQPDTHAMLAHAVEEAARLLKADGAMVYLVEDDRLRFAVDAGIRNEEARQLIRGLSLPVGVGLFGHAVATGEVVVSQDYRHDKQFQHSAVADRIVAVANMRSMAAAPLIAEGEVIGALGAYSSQANDFDEAEIALLRALADHAAATVANQRLIDRLARSQEELAHRVEAQRTLAEMAAQLTSLRTPSEVLTQTLKAAVRLLRGHGGQIGMVITHPDGSMRWGDGHSLVHGELAPFTKYDHTTVDDGVSGRALHEGRVSWTDDYLIDASFAHDRPSDEIASGLGIRAVIAAPLIGASGVIGVIGVYAEEPSAFDADARELLGLLADQAAIVLANARLDEQLGEESAALARQTASQRRLLQINERLLSTLDPASVLELIADGLKTVVWYDYLGVYRVDPSEGLLRPVLARDRNAEAVLGFPIPRGQGVTWWSVEHREPVLLNEALSDPRVIRIPGTPDEPEAIIIVPLISGDEVSGAMNIARRGGVEVAFSDADFELVQLFAGQAAVAITNARLYEQLRQLYAEVEESERRYRHLVDNSPDIVWSVDDEGNFNFFSDSLEARTGWKAQDLLGRHFTTFAGEGTLPSAVSAWARLQSEPNREQRVRLDLPLPDGRLAQTEVAMTGTVVDGRFAGAHGSVRDISERERLEGDLRGQAAELAASQERAHLARELHDSVTQALFSMGLTLRTLELLLDVDESAARTKLGEARELQQDALAEMRTLLFELRPASLESDGLVQALRTHATAVQRRTGLVIVVDAEPIDRLPLTSEEALYRIGQEALHNVVKHANAENATIRILREGDRIRVSITDDGAGFEPEQVPRGHLGLIGMRQRVDLVGGDLRVESRTGGGTIIEASVPIDEVESAE